MLQDYVQKAADGASLPCLYYPDYFPDKRNEQQLVETVCVTNYNGAIVTDSNNPFADRNFP